VRWSIYLNADSVFLAQDDRVMVYGTPNGIAVVEFSEEDAKVTSYPDAAAFAEAMKVKHANLVTRAAAMRRLTATLPSRAD
jgi:hypothetical protein